MFDSSSGFSQRLWGDEGPRGSVRDHPQVLCGRPNHRSDPSRWRTCPLTGLQTPHPGVCTRRSDLTSRGRSWNKSVGVETERSELSDLWGCRLRYASITHDNPPPNCQRESCIVGNVGFNEEDGIKKRYQWHESEMINPHYYSTDYSIKK